MSRYEVKFKDVEEKEKVWPYLLLYFTTFEKFSKLDYDFTIKDDDCDDFTDVLDKFNIEYKYV